MAAPELTRWLGSRIVWPSTSTVPASIRVFRRERDRSARWRASTRSNLSPASSGATRTDVGVGEDDAEGGGVMNVSGARRRANLSIASEPAESAAAQVVARARIIMLISALTTVLAIGAVVTVIGYRMFGGNGPTVATDDIIPLPKGARLISTSASAGRLAVLIEIDGVNELRTFDIKTLKQTGRLRFTREP
jgi:hypothetical protein